ncbi:NAD-dependent protein deacetylase Sirt6-like [Saccostrea cucullata]|uniref:NAD-dependent protein deacetylase Sirt6-like n=1 Tax=Saccostrea cuccullata TaxID=36930 RepID=UPI002ED19FF6
MATGTDGTVKCRLIYCDKGPIGKEDGHADVRAYAVPKSKRSGFLVNWNDEGFATFHTECWFALRGLYKDKESPLTKDEKEMVKEAAKTVEIHDSCAKFEQEADHIVSLIKNADYCIAFTGAGISTAAGIGDFRGIQGKWTEKDKVQEHGSKGRSKREIQDVQKLRPTYTHEALFKLIEMGNLKHVISQNVDGLHRLSGLEESQITELHGNMFVEKCEKCKKRYERNFRCNGKSTKVPVNICKQCRINHRTGRSCSEKKCTGYLMNTIINFGDYLEVNVFRSGVEQASRADLVLALGTTLKVFPANEMVKMGKRPTRLIICNRQVTDFDETCLKVDDDEVPYGSRVFGDCDKLMREVMKRILPEEELSKWEQDRDVRMLTYDTKRKL